MALKPEYADLPYPKEAQITECVYHKSARKVKLFEPDWKNYILDPCKCIQLGKDCSDISVCENKAILYECGRKCPDEICGNKKIQHKDWCLTLMIFEDPLFGKGVMTTEAIPANTFVAEYVGEVVSVAEFEKRLNNDYSGQEKVFGMYINSNYVIDSYKTGNIASFMNSHCEPNCRVDNFCVLGYPRITIWTKRDIDPGEQLFYKYNFANYGEIAKFECMCGSKKCVSNKNKTDKSSQKMFEKDDLNQADNVGQKKDKEEESQDHNENSMPEASETKLAQPDIPQRQLSDYASFLHNLMEECKRKYDKFLMETCAPISQNKTLFTMDGIVGKGKLDVLNNPFMSGLFFTQPPQTSTDASQLLSLEYPGELTEKARTSEDQSFVSANDSSRGTCVIVQPITVSDQEVQAVPSFSTVSTQTLITLDDPFAHVQMGNDEKEASMNDDVDETENNSDTGTNFNDDSPYNRALPKPKTSSQVSFPKRRLKKVIKTTSPDKKKKTLVFKLNKTMSCDKCDYKCFQKSVLDRHMLKHSDVKPEKCPECGKSFKTKSTLGRHIREKHTADAAGEDNEERDNDGAPEEVEDGEKDQD